MVSPKTGFGPKHNSHYPWDEWFARSATAELRLVRGKDFHQDCLPSSFGVMLRTRMSKRGLYRTVLVRGDVVTIGPKRANCWRGPLRKAQLERIRGNA